MTLMAICLILQTMFALHNLRWKIKYRAASTYWRNEYIEAEDRALSLSATMRDMRQRMDEMQDRIDDYRNAHMDE